MKKAILSVVTLAILSMTLLFSPQISYANYANGSYDVSFEIKDSGGQNTSIANGYFLNPAKLTIEDGKYFVQFTVKNSEWIKSVSTSYGEATTVSEDKSNDQRTMKLQVPHIDQAIDLNMHIVVPEEVAQMEYDNHHKTKLTLNASNIPSKESEESGETKSSHTDDSDEDKGGVVTPEDNPKTGDQAPIVLFVFLGTLSLLFLVFRQKLFASEKN